MRQRAWSRGNDYNKNIADVQQSNPKQWWSAVKKIAGLSTPKMTRCCYTMIALTKEKI